MKGFKSGFSIKRRIQRHPEKIIIEYLRMWDEHLTRWDRGEAMAHLSNSQRVNWTWSGACLSIP